MSSLFGNSHPVIHPDESQQSLNTEEYIKDGYLLNVAPTRHNRRILATGIRSRRNRNRIRTPDSSPEITPPHSPTLLSEVVNPETINIDLPVERENEAVKTYMMTDKVEKGLLNKMKMTRDEYIEDKEAKIYNLLKSKTNLENMLLKKELPMPTINSLKKNIPHKEIVLSSDIYIYLFKKCKKYNIQRLLDIFHIRKRKLFEPKSPYTEKILEGKSKINRIYTLLILIKKEENINELEKLIENLIYINDTLNSINSSKLVVEGTLPIAEHKESEKIPESDIILLFDDELKDDKSKKIYNIPSVKIPEHKLYYDITPKEINYGGRKTNKKWRKTNKYLTLIH